MTDEHNQEHEDQKKRYKVSNELVLYDSEPEQTPMKKMGTTTSRREPSTNGRAPGRKLIPWHRKSFLPYLTINAFNATPHTHIHN
jgi:hypothetical protein